MNRPDGPFRPGTSALIYAVLIVAGAGIHQDAYSQSGTEDRRIREAGRIEGIVLDERGTTRPDVRVELLNSDPRNVEQILQTTRTDASGRFRLDPPAGIYRIRARVPSSHGYTEIQGVTQHLEVLPGQTSEIVLDARFGVSAQVWDVRLNDGTAPLVLPGGRTFQVSFRWWMWAHRFQPFTDANLGFGFEAGPQEFKLNRIIGTYPGTGGTGTVTLRAPREPGEHIVYAAPLYITDTQESALRLIYQDTVESMPERLIALGTVRVLPLTSVVFGIVRDEEGQPLERVRVELREVPSEALVDTVVTDEDGRFRIPTIAGSYALSSSAASDVRGYSDGFNITVAAEDSLRSDLEVPAGRGLRIHRAILGDDEHPQSDLTGYTLLPVELDFRIWNPEDCATCDEYIVVGIGPQAHDSILVETPAVYPGTVGKAVFHVRVPAEIGHYELYALITPAGMTAEAISVYNRDWARRDFRHIPLGTIRVTRPPER